jgi:hypothetical protein
LQQLSSTMPGVNNKMQNAHEPCVPHT